MCRGSRSQGELEEEAWKGGQSHTGMRFRGPVTGESRAEGTRRSALLWPRQ